MKTLEEILRDYFGCAKPFKKNGCFTYRGANAYNKLIALVDSVGALTNISTTKIVRALDEITNENY